MLFLVLIAGTAYVAPSLIPVGRASALVTATVTVGTGPIGIGVNPTTNRIYVADEGVDSSGCEFCGSVAVIDGNTNTVIATVPVSGPLGVGVNPVTNRIYVAARNSGSVAVIDGSANSVTANVPVGSIPYGIGVNPTTNRIYVANYFSNTVPVIDGSTNSVIATVAVGVNPYGIGVNPTTNRIYVANSGSNTISVIDGSTDTVTDTVAVGARPYNGVGVNPITNRVYVAIQGPNTVSVIDGSTDTVTDTVPVGSTPLGVGVNPISNRVYVANYFSNTVSVIDGITDTVTDTVAVGMNPYDVGVNPTTNTVYVANRGCDCQFETVPGTVSVIGGIDIKADKFFTDANLNPLSTDKNGNPMVSVVLARGIVQSTNPGQVLAWVNVTNTGSTSLQSLKLNETLPVDWTIDPPWMPALGAIHVYYANTTSLATSPEITQASTITVSTGNPETVQLAIPSLNATAIGHPLLPGQSILLSVKLSYGLIKTSQSFTSYPRNDTDTASAVAWTLPSYTGAEASAAGSAFFIAYAKVVGDPGGDTPIIDVSKYAIV
jgi:YVTN family beta-propeller protein